MSDELVQAVEEVAGESVTETAEIEAAKVTNTTKKKKNTKPDDNSKADDVKQKESSKADDAKTEDKAGDAKPEGNGKTDNTKKTLIYLGPNVPGGILHTGAVFKGSIPAYLSDTLKENPGLEKLFVDVKEAGTKKAEIERKGSEPHRLFQQFNNRLRQKKKGDNE